MEKKENMGILSTPRGDRQSGIELLKIIAILWIILGHITQTLETGSNDYNINLALASGNIQHIILQNIRTFGLWGNTMSWI